MSVDHNNPCAVYLYHSKNVPGNIKYKYNWLQILANIQITLYIFMVMTMFGSVLKFPISYYILTCSLVQYWYRSAVTLFSLCVVIVMLWRHNDRLSYIKNNIEIRKKISFANGFTLKYMFIISHIMFTSGWCQYSQHKCYCPEHNVSARLTVSIPSTHFIAPCHHQRREQEHSQKSVHHGVCVDHVFVAMYES